VQVLFPVFLGLAQLALQRSVYAFATWGQVLLYAEAGCACWLALTVAESQRIRARTKLALSIFGTVFALVALLQWYVSPAMLYGLIPLRPDEQGMGPFQNRDHYCAFIELLMPAATWEALGARKAAPIFGVAAALMYASVIASQSRAGVIVATVEVLLLAIAALVRGGRRKIGRSGKRTVVVLCLFLVVGSIAGADLVMERFEQKDEFAHRREYFWSSVDMAKLRPGLGYGLGTWPFVYPRFAKFDPGTYANHAHDEWVEWACEGGVALLLAFFVVMARSAWLAWKFPAALGICAVFVHNAVDFNMREHPIPLFMLALLGWAEVSVRAGDGEATDRRPHRRTHGLPDSTAPVLAEQNAAAADAAAADPL
jgi:O-antigen ligase